MCAGSLINARVQPLVSGAADLRVGATGSLYDVCSDPRVNHNSTVKYGVLAPESQAQLQEFFIQERDKEKIPVIGPCFARESPGSSVPRGRHYHGSHGHHYFGNRPASAHLVSLHHWLAGTVCRDFPRCTSSTGSRTCSSVSEGESIHGRGRISISGLQRQLNDVNEVVQLLRDKVENDPA